MKNIKNIVIAFLAIALVVLAYMLLTNNSWRNNPEDSDLDSNSNVVNEPPPPTPTPAPAPVPAGKKTFDQAVSENWLLANAAAEGQAFNLMINVPQPMTLNFDKANKTISGFSGCNTFSGSFTSSGPGKLDLASILSTKKYCAETSALEDDLLSVMDSVSKYEVSANGNLVLASDDGLVRIEYKPAI